VSHCDLAFGPDTILFGSDEIAFGFCVHAYMTSRGLLRVSNTRVVQSSVSVTSRPFVQATNKKLSSRQGFVLGRTATSAVDRATRRSTARLFARSHTIAANRKLVPRHGYVLSRAAISAIDKGTHKADARLFYRAAIIAANRKLVPRHGYVLSRAAIAASTKPLRKSTGYMLARTFTRAALQHRAIARSYVLTRFLLRSSASRALAINALAYLASRAQSRAVAKRTTLSSARNFVRGASHTLSKSLHKSAARAQVRSSVSTTARKVTRSNGYASNRNLFRSTVKFNKRSTAVALVRAHARFASKRNARSSARVMARSGSYHAVRHLGRTSAVVTQRLRSRGVSLHRGRGSVYATARAFVLANAQLSARLAAARTTIRAQSRSATKRRCISSVYHALRAHLTIVNKHTGSANPVVSIRPIIRAGSQSAHKANSTLLQVVYARAVVYRASFAFSSAYLTARAGFISRPVKPESAYLRVRFNVLYVDRTDHVLLLDKATD
jgi:hypothetical protein